MRIFREMTKAERAELLHAIRQETEKARNNNDLQTLNFLKILYNDLQFFTSTSD